MFTRVLFLFFFCLFVGSSRSQTCTALGNGDWANAGTWSCAGGPGCGASIVIPAGITVTITNQQDYSTCSPTPAASPQIYIFGCLKFTNGNKLKLPCGSNVYIAPTGSMVPGSGGGNSNYLEICDNIVWNAAAGTATGPTIFCGNPPCSSLPVELVAFTGVEEQKVVYLNWKTASESNNDHYDVEKSYDGVNFVSIMSVNSRAPDGTSLLPLEYNAIDRDLKHPVYYYRLKQVDKDGIYKHTKMISVRIYAAEFNIYPNPNNGTFSIEVPSVKLNETLTVVIYNSIGQKVHESSQLIMNDNITGSRADIVPSLPLPKGVYSACINFAGETSNLKLVVN